jgi:hypothetical protein
MAKIKITIQDDFGKVITETADKEYQLDLGKATLTEIEGAVEDLAHVGFRGLTHPVQDLNP